MEVINKEGRKRCKSEAKFIPLCQSDIKRN